MISDESLALWAGRAVVFLTQFAAVAGWIALKYANRVAAAKDAELARFQATSNEAIAKAQARAADADLRAAQAHERAAASELATARLSEAAAKEQSARLALDRRTANRSLTSDQRQAAAAALSKFAGQRAEIFVFPVHFETSTLADTIYAVLLTAKWNVARPQRLIEPPVVPSDTHAGTVLVQSAYFQATPDPDSKAAGKQLYESLKETPAGGIWSSDDLSGPPRVFILVGDKPTPLINWVK